MSILTTTDRKEFEAKRAKVAQAIREEMAPMHRDFLRKCFDSTKVDSFAQACIDVARELGFTDMANEMEIDYYLEKESAE